ncbi:MAG: hypothetical protein ACJATS_002359, partial [Psychroserpens sp.]
DEEVAGSNPATPTRADLIIKLALEFFGHVPS